MRKALKRSLSLLLAITIIFGSAYAGLGEVDWGSVFAVKASAASSGICGDNLTWTFDDEGVLTISGTGDMTNYSSGSETPWYNEQLNICSVVISNGVTSIGDCAFEFCGDSLISVRLPNSIMSIGYESFYYCTSLTTITIPENVQSIGYSAFFGCTGLTSITIPDNVKSIGESAFTGCDKLASISVGGNNNNYSSVDGVLFNKDKTVLIKYPANKQDTEYIIPDSVTNIENVAFDGCNNLVSVLFPNSMTYIADQAFFVCENLTSIIIPDSVVYIGSRAFDHCKKLMAIDVNTNNCNYSSIDGVLFNKDQTTLIAYPIGKPDYEYEIPEGVIHIEYAAFSNCNNLVSIVIPDGVESIDWDAFDSCAKLKAIVIPDTVTSIGMQAFYGCYDFSYVFYRGSETEWSNITIGENNTPLLNASVYYNFTEHSYGEYNIVKNPTCSELGEKEHSCSVCGYTEIIDIPTLNHNYSTKWTIDTFPTCTEEGSKSYHCLDCGNKTDVTVIAPTGHNYVDGECVYCEINSSFVYSIENDGVIITDYIGEKEEVRIPSEIYGYPVIAIGEYAFVGCSSIKSVSIPDSVKNIGVAAFRACESLTSIVIPDSVTSIGAYAFSYCTAIESADISENISVIEEAVFQGCNSLTQITIPDNVTNINHGAFAGCKSIATLIIPDSVTSIGGEAFYRCYSITSITIPENVTSIGDAVFEGCKALTSIIIPKNITVIPDNAFWGCSQLRDISFSNSITSIGEYAFHSCYELQSVFYNGLEKEWSEVTIATGNDHLLGASVHYNSTGHTMFDGVCQVCSYSKWNYELYDDYAVITGYNSNEADVVIPDTICGLPITEIDEAAFAENDILRSVTIGDNVTKIGDNAFCYCLNLSSVTISESVTHVGVTAFAYCTELENLIIPKNVSNIDFGAFAYCLGMQCLQVDDENQNYSSENGVLFNKDKSKLVCYPAGINTSTYVIPDTVKTISDASFTCAQFLESIVIHKNVKTIGLYAFGECPALRSVTIEDGVVEICDNTFYECPSLVFVRIPNSVINIGADAFYNFTGEIYCTNSSYAHEYAVANNIKYVLESTDEPEEPIQGTGNTQIDYANFIIRTSVQGCNDISEIIGKSQSAIIVATPSYEYNELKIYGTGTTIAVFDGDNFIGEFTMVVDCDLNGDSVVDVLDSSQMALASSGKKTLDGAYAMAADSNSDDIIDINDYQDVVNKAVS